MVLEDSRPAWPGVAAVGQETSVALRFLDDLVQTGQAAAVEVGRWVAPGADFPDEPAFGVSFLSTPE